MIREGKKTLPMSLGEMPHELIFVVVTIVVIVVVLVVPLSWLSSYSQLPLSAFPTYDPYIRLGPYCHGRTLRPRRYGTKYGITAAVASVQNLHFQK